MKIHHIRCTRYYRTRPYDILTSYISSGLKVTSYKYCGVTDTDLNAIFNFIDIHIEGEYLSQYDERFAE